MRDIQTLLKDLGFNLGFDFSEEVSNPELIDKKFKIIWENKKVKYYDMSGENVIEVEAKSIVSVELLK